MTDATLVAVGDKVETVESGWYDTASGSEAYIETGVTGRVVHVYNDGTIILTVDFGGVRVFVDEMDDRVREV